MTGSLEWAPGACPGALPPPCRLPSRLRQRAPLEQAPGSQRRQVTSLGCSRRRSSRPRRLRRQSPASPVESRVRSKHRFRLRPRRLLPPPVASQPGGFTSMFQTPAAGPTPTPPAPPVSSKPGEFTSMFQAQTPAQGTPAPSAPPAPSEPGSFTRMFQSPASASPAPTPPPPQATSKPGEFTQFFQSSLGSAPYKESSPSATPHVASPPPAPPPGEYTRLFQMPAQQPGPTPAGSGATNVFVTPSAPSPQPAAPMESGPSEFTRMIQAPPPAEARPRRGPQGRGSRAGG